MSEQKSVAWGPTARTEHPHEFQPVVRDFLWCSVCGWAEDAYVHASEEERRAFDEARAASAERERRIAALLLLRRHGVDLGLGGGLATSQIDALAEVVKGWED
jgi:hypothetical protein